MGVVKALYNTSKPLEEKGILRGMATVPSHGQSPREELERVLSSACFARSEGLSRLLRFLVERQLEGREGELKESLIGVEVYGRRPDYDPSSIQQCEARWRGFAHA